MKKTIFNVFVAMDSQETCDRMKAVCLENGLPIWKHSMAFDFMSKGDVLVYSKLSEEFFIMKLGTYYDVAEEDIKTQVTEAEFLELLNEYKNGIQNN
jgi:hypothetical protein